MSKFKCSKCGTEMTEASLEEVVGRSEEKPIRAPYLCEACAAEIRTQENPVINTSIPSARDKVPD